MAISVLHVFKTFFPDSVGGVETFISSLSKNTMPLGVENSIFTLSDKPKTDNINLPHINVVQGQTHFTFCSTNFSLNSFSKFSELSKSHDIVHYHFPNPFGDILQFFCKPQTPYIVTYHSDVLRPRIASTAYLPLRNFFLKRAKQLIVTSPNYFATSKTLNSFSENVSIIPIGIEVESFGSSDEQCKLYWQQKLPTPFFLFLGVLRHYKGLHIAIEAVAGTSVQLVIAGTGPNEQKLKKLVREKKLQNVYFLGKISETDKVALLNLCLALVFPSNERSESFGISLLEAAACGKPMISCEIGTGTTFINLHEHTGLVIPPNSPIHLKEAMFRLSTDPSLTSKLGANAKKRAITVFNAKRQAKLYAKVYETVLDG